MFPFLSLSSDNYTALPCQGLLCSFRWGYSGIGMNMRYPGSIGGVSFKHMPLLFRRQQPGTPVSLRSQILHHKCFLKSGTAQLRHACLKALGVFHTGTVTVTCRSLSTLNLAAILTVAGVENLSFPAIMASTRLPKYGAEIRSCKHFPCSSMFPIA